MRFCSTRDPQLTRGFGEALRLGLAPDGGLFVPQAWPARDAADWPQDLPLPSVAQRLIAPFVVDDALALALPEMTREAFNFPAPLVSVAADKLNVLELFHGPTAAFKDFGARFLAACFQRLLQPGQREVNILVATSGDTGGAVAAAFHRRPGVKVTVLFSQGQVSPMQQQQLTCWGDNVRSLAVRASFDACQHLVKQAFVDPALRARFELSSANSINLGRLLPQVVYYAATSLAIFRKAGRRPSFIIPSGNLGNAVACVWARQLGLPIDEIVLAHNANRSVPDFLRTGEWTPHASIPTLASAMDVGNPSNMERLRALFPELNALRLAVSAFSVDDAAIAARIRSDFANYGRIWCPHTATAAEVYERLPEALRARGPWVLVATAHPAKFREIVQPLVGRDIEMPETLRQLFERPSYFGTIDATLESLRRALST